MASVCCVVGVVGVVVVFVMCNIIHIWHNKQTYLKHKCKLIVLIFITLCNILKINLLYVFWLLYICTIITI